MSGANAPLQDVAASPEASGSQKKSPLDNLSRDDLLKKCKSLLTIAQKAKQAKDDALEEVKQVKHQLNVNIQESQLQKQTSDKLASRVRTLAEEKESFMFAVENVKSNNAELQNIVRSISAERDSFFEDVEKLTAEKQKLIKVVDMLGGENDAMVAENRNLKDDKRRLNEELFTAIAERETIECEIKEVKLQLVYLLNNSFNLLKHLEIEISPNENSAVETNKKHTGVVCDLIAKSNNNLQLVNESLSRSSSQVVTPSDQSMSSDVACNVEEMQLQLLESQTKLCTETDELKRQLTSLENQIECFKEENIKLQEEIVVLKNTSTNDAKRENELMNELERNRTILSGKTTDIHHLKDEISVLMAKNKEQSFNAKEMQGTKNLISQLEIAANERSREMQAMKIVSEEFEECNSKLAIQVDTLEQELSDHRNKMSTLIAEKEGLQRVISNQIVSIENLQKEFGELNQVKDDNCKALLELEQLKGVLVNTKKELENKNLLLAESEQNVVENHSKCTTLIEKHSTDILNLQKLLDDKDKELLETLKQKQSEHDSIVTIHISETNNLRSQVTLLEEKVASLSGDMATPFEAMAESLTKTLVDKEQELVALQKQVLDMTQQLSTYCHEIDKDRDEKSKLEHLVKLKEQELTTLQAKCTKETHIASHDIALLQKEIVRLQQCKAELKSTRDQSSVADVQSKALHEEIKALKAGRDSAVQLLQQELDILKKETLRFEETLKLRNSELKSAQDFAKEMKAKNKSVRAELKQLKTDRDAAFESLQRDVDALKADRSKLQDTLNSCNAELTVLQENSRQFEDKNKSHREEIETLRSSCETRIQLLQCELDTVKAEALRLDETLHDRDTELQTCKENAGEFEANNKVYEEQIKTLKADHSSEVQRMQRDLAVLEEDIARARAELQGHEDKLKSTQENAKEIEVQREGKASELQAEVYKLLNAMAAHENDTASILEKHTIEVEELKTQHDSKIAFLQKSLDALNQEASTLRETVNLREEELKTVKNMREKNEGVEKELQEEAVSNYKTTVEKLNADLKQVKDENDSRSKDYESKLAELNADRNKLDGDYQTALAELEQVRTDRDTLDRDCQSRMSEMERATTEQLRAADERYTTKQESLADELVNLRNSLAEKEASLVAARSDLEAAMLKNEQLLSDMNELNQVLKQRGEVIAKLKDVVKETEQKTRDCDARLSLELQAKITELEAVLNEVQVLKASNGELMAEVNAVKEVNREVTEEVGRLRSRVTQLEKEFKDHGDTASEALSCSTMSRAEEVGRLRDVEDSFEDRYTKLRAIAVRLKKRNAELTAQLEVERTRAQALTASAKNVPALQAEHDKLQDLHESALVELKSAKKLLEAGEAVKMCLDEIKAENKRLTVDMEAANRSRQAFEVKVKDLKSEVTAARGDCRDRELQLTTATERLVAESQAHTATRSRLEAVSRESKRDAVRRLEMDDYERTVADLEDQLASEKARVAEMEARLVAQGDIVAGLKEQVAMVQDTMKAEETRANEVTDQLNAMRTRLSETVAQVSERDSELLELRSVMEASQAASEQCGLQAAQLAADKMRSEETGRAKLDTLTQQVRHLEDELKVAQNGAAQSSKELARISAEFEGYKVRARSVLRQKTKTEEPQAQGGGGEEVAQLRAALEACSAKLEVASSKLSVSDTETATLQADRDRVLAKCRQLSEQASALSAANQQLTSAGKAASAEHKDAMARQKIHYEIMLTNYKTQLQELEDKLTGDNAILRDQMEKLEDKLTREKSAKHSIGRAADGWTNSGASFQPVRSGAESGAMPLLEREEGEGSESVDSTSPSLGAGKDRHELLSLEKLLASTSLDADNPETVSSPATELARARDRINMAEQQVRHMSALLAEAEQDLARLTQLNEVLKEEIRRNQRSDEREKLAHNQEYLKNVVLKFVTLQGGDERSRLVPVLNTILRLSPAETTQLASVARGGDLPGTARGWGSYLFK